jgi:hypothetical protein
VASTHREKAKGSDWGLPELQARRKYIPSIDNVLSVLCCPPSSAAGIDDPPFSVASNYNSFCMWGRQLYFHFKRNSKGRLMSIFVQAMPMAGKTNATLRMAFVHSEIKFFCSALLLISKFDAAPITTRIRCPPSAQKLISADHFVSQLTIIDYFTTGSYVLYISH